MLKRELGSTLTGQNHPSTNVSFGIAQFHSNITHGTRKVISTTILLSAALVTLRTMARATICKRLHLAEATAGKITRPADVKIVVDMTMLSTYHPPTFN